MQLIVPTKSSLIRPGEINRLGVRAEGSHFTLFINEMQVAELDNSRLSQGAAGLIASLVFGGVEAEFAFDSFELQTP